MSSKKATEKETKPAAKKEADKKAAPKAATKTAKPSGKPSDKKTATAGAVKKTAAPKDAAKEVKVAKNAAKDEPKSEKAAKAVKSSAEKTAKEVKTVKVVANEKAVASGEVKKVSAVKSGHKVGTALVEEGLPPMKSESLEVQVRKPSSGAKSDKKVNEYDYAVLLEGVKKLSKAVMFFEVDEQEDRSNKKKMSSEMKNIDMKPTAAIRRKASLADETQEELTERILKELEEQNLAFEREAASQMCTRCNQNLVSPEFWVDKHLGYCEECATILKLGQSKEARKVEYQLGGMGDSLDEEDDEILGPDADDLKDAEEDLAEMED